VYVRTWSDLSLHSVLRLLRERSGVDPGVKRHSRNGASPLLVAVACPFAMMMWLCTLLVVAMLTVVRVEAFLSPVPQRISSRKRALFAASQTASDASRLKRIASLTDWGKAADVK